MGIPLKELQDRMDSATFALYMAYDRLDPFGEERADVRTGIMTSYLYNAFTGAKTKIDNFILEYDKEIVKADRWQDPKIMFAMACQITHALGGEVS